MAFDLLRTGGLFVRATAEVVFDGADAVEGQISAANQWSAPDERFGSYLPLRLQVTIPRYDNPLVSSGWIISTVRATGTLDGESVTIVGTISWNYRTWELIPGKIIIA